MASSDFEIEIVSQGWLKGADPETDPCSQGEIRLVIGGETISPPDGTGDYGISEAALAVLRTIDSDHSARQPVAERLVPHGCGTILMMGCPIGIDWSVTHVREKVRLADAVRFDGTSDEEAVRFPGLSATLDVAEYRRRIVAFADEAKQPFAAPPKTFSDEFDRKHYAEFWEEYESRLAAARAAG